MTAPLTSLTTLPADCLRKVSSYLPNRDLMAFSSTCRRVNWLVETDRFGWRQRAQQEGIPLRRANKASFFLQYVKAERVRLREKNPYREGREKWNQWKEAYFHNLRIQEAEFEHQEAEAMHRVESTYEDPILSPKDRATQNILYGGVCFSLGCRAVFGASALVDYCLSGGMLGLGVMMASQGILYYTIDSEIYPKALGCFYAAQKKVTACARCFFQKLGIHR